MTLWNESERAERRPFTFDGAKAAVIRGHDDGTKAETGIRTAAREFASKERVYRIALAQKILTLKAGGMAVTAAQDVARGDQHVADKKYERDVAEGAYEAARQVGFKVAADRRELEQLVNWSMRVAPDGQDREPEGPAQIIGGRRVA